MEAMGVPRGDPSLPLPPTEDIQRTKSHRGDSIVIVLLNHAGWGVEEVKHLQTGLDWVRGMRVSDNGKYLAAAGEMREGGLEVYEISGERGETLELVARDDSVKDVNCVLWL